jgi:hypothetical protein
MHIGSDSDVMPLGGRHAYMPGQKWPYGLTEAVIIMPEDSRYAPFAVDAAYVRKHKPEAGGYYVQYKDGYRSFSPATAFEEGYTRL